MTSQPRVSVTVILLNHYSAEKENAQYNVELRLISSHPLRRNKQGISKNPLKSVDFRGFLVRVTRFERAISTSQMWRGTNSATPGYSVFAIIPRWGRKSKFFLSVVNPVVKAVFRSVFTTCQNPANARAARLSGLPLLSSWMVPGPLPNHARYQLRYTRITVSAQTAFIV